MTCRRLCSLVGLIVLAILPIQAKDYTIYVAPKDSPAYAVAEGKADNTVFAERTLHKALGGAAKLLQTGSHTVTIMIAGGVYDGKAGRVSGRFPR